MEESMPMLTEELRGREGLHHTSYRRRGNPVKDTIIICGDIIRASLVPLAKF